MTTMPTQANDSYQQYHQNLIQRLIDHMRSAPPFDQGNTEDSQDKQQMLEHLDVLSNLKADFEQRQASGQWLITTIISHYPQHTPAVARDLFWYFGGDCLHFLGDEEISYFQQLDEAYHLAQSDVDTTNASISYPEIIQQLGDTNNQFH